MVGMLFYFKKVSLKEYEPLSIEDWDLVKGFEPLLAKGTYEDFCKLHLKKYEIMKEKGFNIEIHSKPVEFIDQTDLINKKDVLKNSLEGFLAWSDDPDYKIKELNIYNE